MNESKEPISGRRARATYDYRTSTVLVDWAQAAIKTPGSIR
jgi:hypothetical protein